MKIEQKGVHDSLVRRLREPIMFGSGVEEEVAEKLNAIGEALAYIIEKKHTKRKFKTTKKIKHSK